MNTFWYIVGILWFLIVEQHGVRAQELGKSQANSYFYLKQNGGYEYAFNTDTGLQSSQIADQENEVSGHYMYYDKGIPFMVKYKAGIHGFQPEIVPVEQLMNGNNNQFLQPKLQEFNTVAASSLNARDLRAGLPDNSQNNYRMTQNQHLQSPTVSSFNIGQDSTLNFVQNALKTMQTQPMHLSFNSDLGQIQHPAVPPFVSTTLRPPIVAPPQTQPQPPPATTTLLQPVSRSEVQEINNLAALPLANTIEPKHPYSFNYNADQSARSETSDPSGNVIGSYSYYDEAGYHDISYKANDDTGFVVLGGNLAYNQPDMQIQADYSQQHSNQFSPQQHHPNQLIPQQQEQQQQQQPHPNQLLLQQYPNQFPQQRQRQLFRSNNFNFNNYRLSSNALDERNLGKRSLRTTPNNLDARNLDKRSLRSTNKIIDDRNLGKRSLKTTTNTLDERNSGKRSLRKFRRYAKW